ncbi:MAG: TIGR01440 family protein [Clostridia bacterium]|nr:TIGR01440 family protein [Clostridia bacterium]
MYEKVKEEAAKAVSELLAVAGLKKGDVFVVGCSSSEIVGNVIGKGSTFDAAKAVFDAVYPILKENGIYLAAQCCEHLNRAVITERECAEKYGYEIVSVRPQPKAGGSFATAAYDSFEAPVALEAIKADAGIDIGGTLIGMHLRAVAVPVRLSLSKIGEANILCARTRPKYIGGCRSVYEDNK